MPVADLALARRLELAEAASFAEYAQAAAQLYPDSGACALSVAGGSAVFGGAGSPIARTLGLGLTGPVLEADLELVEQFYRKRGLPAAVDVCPLADGSLRDLVARRGYRLKSFMQVHVRELGPAEPEPALAPGQRVELAGPEEADIWAHTVISGFAGRTDLPAGDPLAVIFQVRKGIVIRYLARVQGEPAAAASMLLKEGLALLFGTSTLPQFRGQGLQNALLRARLAAAARAGCDLTVVTTTPGSASERNVYRAGFRPAYTRALMIRDAD